MICDNDVVITGANLSEQYFISRKDRYILIKNCPELADYLEEFMDCFLQSGELYRVNRDFNEDSETPLTNTELKAFFSLTSNFGE